MEKGTTHVAFDDSKRKIVAGILRPEAMEPEVREIANDPRFIRRLFERLKREGPVLACYEAGVSGYDLYRQLTEGLAHDGAVLGLRQAVVVAVPGARFGELHAELLQEFGHGVVELMYSEPLSARQAIGRDADGHGRGSGQDLGQTALAIGVEVLDKHEGQNRYPWRGDEGAR